MTRTDFPREDLAPLRHQQVRALLVREASAAVAPRRAVRRALPAVAALAVAGTALAVPTGLAGQVTAGVGSLVRSATDPCPPRGDVGYSPRFRSPGSADDTRAVRYLPAGPVEQVRYYASSSCVLAERDDRPVQRPQAVWTMARLDGSARVRASATLWRGLAQGVSRQVADRTSQRLPTDQGDPGTVLDPPFEQVQVRGVSGTLVRGAGRRQGEGDVLTVVWTEPGGRQWSLSASGLDAAALVALADGFDVEGDRVTARVEGADVVTPDRARTASVPASSWMRLDVPAVPGDVTPGDVVWTPSLSAVRPTASGRVVVGVVAPDPWTVPWQAQVRRGDRLVDVGDALGLLDPDGRLVWTTAGGGRAELAALTAVPEQVLLDVAASVEPVGADDPRLVGAAPAPD